MSPSVTEKKMLSIAELLLVYFEPLEENGYKDIDDFYNRTSVKGLKPNPDTDENESDSGSFNPTLTGNSSNN